MKLKISLIIIMACASTCTFLLLPNIKNEKPKFIEEPKTEEIVYQEVEPEYVRSKVSYYNRTYCEKFNPKCVTASGEIFDDTSFTCACSNKYPLGTVFEIRYNEKSITVRCNDRGSFSKYGRTLDLSEASFEALSPLSKGVIEVEIKLDKITKAEYN